MPTKKKTKPKAKKGDFVDSMEGMETETPKQSDPIKWTLKAVTAKDITPNDRNPKRRNEKGFTRLKKSLELFGRVFDGIANSDGKLLDGHSRLELSKPNDTLNIFYPSRQLTAQEVKEFAAVYDGSKAGDLDFDIIIEDLGQDFIDEWEFEVFDEEENKEGEVEDIDSLLSSDIKNKEKIECVCPKCGFSWLR